MTRPANSVQLYSVRDHLANDFDRTLVKLAELGFRSVEPFGLPSETSKLKKALVSAGLNAPTAHGSVLADPKAAVSAAVELGTTVLIDPYQPEEIFQSGSKLSQLADELSAAAEIGKQYGVSIGYHNHDHEIRNEIGGVPALIELAKRTSQDVVFEIDLFWCQVGKANPVEILKALEGRVVALHAKDAPAGGGVSDQVPLGKGSVNILECVNMLPNAQVVIEFDEYAGDLFTAIESSLEYLNSNGVN